MTWFAPLEDEAPLDFDPPRVKPWRAMPNVEHGLSYSKWTPEKLALAQKLWQDGLSAKNVAAELGEGFTRNAVISKLHRTGSQARPEPLRPASNLLPPRKAAIRPELRPPPRKKHEPLPFSFKKGPPMMPVPFSPAPAIVTPICEPVTIMGLNEHTCHWPISDDPTKTPVDEFMYCGALTGGIGESYCATHQQLAYTGVPPRKFVQARPRG